MLIEDVCSHLQRKPRLADAARTKERQEFMLTEKSPHFRKILLAATKAGLLDRKIVRNRIERGERGKRHGQTCDGQLPDVFRFGKIS